jgi:hypothetical protein
VAALWFALAAAVPWAAFWAARRRFGDRMAASCAVVFSTLPWLGMSLARPNGLETPAPRDPDLPDARHRGARGGARQRADERGKLRPGRARRPIGARRLDAILLVVAVVAATARRSWQRAGLVAIGAASSSGRGSRGIKSSSATRSP